MEVEQYQVSNGGMLYHEVQESNLCAVHCVNTVLQGPFFSEIDLAALASDLDRSEREVFHPKDDQQQQQQGSHNVSLRGDFSIQVLQKAMEVWDLLVIQLNSPEAESAQVHPELENAFICHLQDHWFCIRKVNGEWYNFNSLYPAPEHLSKFYLSAYLATLKSSGWSIFVVKGNFPRECPITLSEGSNGFGQWLLPEDAERMTKAFNNKQSQGQPQIQRSDATEEFVNPFGTYNEDDDEDLNAAIAASLMDSANNSFKGSSSTIGIAGAAMTQSETKRGSMTELLTSKDSDEDLRAAIAASLMDSENKSLAGSSSTSVTAEAGTSQDGKDVQKTKEK